MRQTRTNVFLIFIIPLAVQTLAAPADTQQSLVVSSTEPSNEKDAEKEGSSLPNVTEIYQMRIQSNIRNRFTNTTIVSKVKNAANIAQEATFSVVLPETAFISGFIMEVDGKNYTAYVKEKEEARRDYDRAVESGVSAAHVAVSARDSNRFTVSVNVEPESKAAFYLNYEELLQRKDGRYEQIINIHPGQPVKDLGVEVHITDSSRIIDLKAPPLRSGNEIGKEDPELDPRADLEIIDPKRAVVRFRPSLERQKQLAHLLGTNENEGLAGQFVVQYDVARDPQGGEVLIQDGYFVHFFAPSELSPLPKHVVFVLDTSYSMHGEKLDQLKKAMHKILDELQENDLFSLVEFNTIVKVWNLEDTRHNVQYPPEDGFSYDTDREIDFKRYGFPNAYVASSSNIKKAKDAVSEFRDTRATDIYSALQVGLHLVEKARHNKVDDTDRQPILVFLTDGEPTVGLKSTTEIISKVTEFNAEAIKSPIFALSFGSDADKDFLQKLAIQNYGFAKHIYDAADAALQLQEFYKLIASPLLSNVHFKYEPSVTSLTKTEFPIHFDGSEIVVCGRYDENGPRLATVEAWGPKGQISLKPHAVEKSISNIERLWAYLTIKQLLEKKEVANADKKKIKKNALDLAIKYSFVTPLSSLVVVKPNATNAVDTEIADGGRRPDPNYQAHRGLTTFGKVHAGISSFADPIFASYDSEPVIPIRVSVEQPSSLADLLSKLPWLQNIMDLNGKITLPSGAYKLGINETITDYTPCSKSINKQTGHCTLLHSCPQVYSYLTSSDIFIQHHCILKNEYAGICCP